jgi:hypothetical protein
MPPAILHVTAWALEAGLLLSRLRTANQDGISELELAWGLAPSMTQRSFVLGIRGALCRGRVGLVACEESGF